MKKEYAKLNIDDISELFKEEPFDIFIRLGDSKFVKIINFNDNAFEVTLENYQRRGVNYLYCKYDKYQQVLSSLERKIDDALEDANSATSIDETFSGLSNSMMGLKGMITNIGITPVTQKKTENLVNATLKESEKDTKLEVLLELLDQKPGFISKQGLLTSYLVVSMIDEMDWTTEAVKKKLVTASLFQNITLDTDEQAMVTLTASEDFNKLDDYSKDLVKNHPHLGAELVHSPGFGGEEVQKLIKNHHEIPVMGGFPGRVSAHNISIMDSCFIIASHFATTALKKEVIRNNYAIVAQSLNEDFSVGGFKRGYQALLKVVANR